MVKGSIICNMLVNNPFSSIVSHNLYIYDTSMKKKGFDSYFYLACLFTIYINC
jgi:hypothetical protein